MGHVGVLSGVAFLRVWVCGEERETGFSGGFNGFGACGGEWDFAGAFTVWGVLL